ncbi:MAG: RuBisCO large subunit C-terminal-like domain-containing protein [Bacteroidota bacterium]
MVKIEIHYRITTSPVETIEDKLLHLILEQSVEIPSSVVSDELEYNIVGEVKQCIRLDDYLYEVVVAWPLDNFGSEISGFLNTLFGNISMHRGFQVTGINWKHLEGIFPGPRFGISSLRTRFDWQRRPLSCASLKPMGFTAEELGERCYQMALGGIDIIKDDHGLLDQNYAPFEKRVTACIDAIQRAADDSGHRARYFPHVSSDFITTLERARFAKEMDVDGIMICPHLTGMSALPHLATSDLNLPIIAHPSFSGSLVHDRSHGLAPSVTYGELPRALGADISIYPNAGGRFPITRKECQEINTALRREEWNLRAAFPMPGGGLSFDALPKWIKVYGPDTIFLLGGQLLTHPDGITDAARTFNQLLRDYAID